MNKLADLRREYALATLDVSNVDPDPIRQFHTWMGDAQRAQIDEPNAMSLATATPDGAPSLRMVLLKGADENGFVFYTDLRSRKAHELQANPRAALCLYWKELERQVRIVGRVSELGREDVEHYFRSRPLGSRLGAWASVQSSTLESRAELDHRLAQARERFSKSEPGAPPEWGGFLVAPEEIEFWQGRPDRLHDRVMFRRAGSDWAIARLSP